MENKLLIFGLVFSIVLLVLGCTETKIQEEAEKITPVVEETKNFESQTNIPIYDAPLTKSIDKTCKKNIDCKLIKYRTGLGVQEICVGPKSDYDGEISEKCICKEVGNTVQTYLNGSEINVPVYECRHI